MKRFTILMGAAISVAALELAELPAQGAEIVLDPANYNGQLQTQAGGPLTNQFLPPRAGTLLDRNLGNDGLSQGFIQAKATQVAIAQGSVTKSETNDPEYYGYFSEIVVSYSFEVLDPSVGVQPVTLYAKSMGSALAAGQSTASGFFEVEQTSPISGNPAKLVLDLSVCAGQGCPAGGLSNYNVDRPVSMLTNTDYLIILQAVAGATNQTSPEAAFSGASSVSIDPYFYLDPSIADPQDYALEFSPGIVNSPNDVAGGVPEPSTWAMMLIGFVGLGCAGYRGMRRSA
jgi:PEP-CTERM motif-containing protein